MEDGVWMPMDGSKSAQVSPRPYHSCLNTASIYNVEEETTRRTWSTIEVGGEGPFGGLEDHQHGCHGVFDHENRRSPPTRTRY